MARSCKLKIFLLIFMLVFAQIPAVAASDSVTLRPGAYVRLGSYMGQPLIWRCVGRDENGLLLLSRDIICFKAYSDGSSRWDKSFLRIWLNSTDERVNWGTVSPDKQHVNGNAYADEPGFLSGFSPEERALIKTVSSKSALNESDIAAADEGSTVHLYNSSGQFIKTIQNYSSAYAVRSSDRVFCPNISQMEVVMTNFPSEFIAAPTASALSQTGNIKNSESRSNSYYWLRDSLGNSEFTESVRMVYPDGRVLFGDSFDSSVGVRPALYIRDEISVVSGNGYESTPYAVTEKVLTSTLPAGSPADNIQRVTVKGAFSSISEGDYLSVGEYNGEEILWRCVDINENGPLMLSDRILSFKAFDASGKHGDQVRDQYGSNSWVMSNIRYWLNSLEGEGAKNWPCGNAPTSDNSDGYNGYSAEKGFLTSFSPEERTILRPVEIRTVIYPADADETTVGSEPLVSQRNVNNIGNYADAFASVTEDTVFLLSIEEANRVKTDFGSFLNANPTASAVNINEADIEGLSADRSAVWWLRDADAEDPGSVRAITLDGWVHSIVAIRSSNGIRPAFYLNMDTAAFLSGNGSREDPYRVEGHTFGDWEEISAPTCTRPGTRRQTCLTCGESREESIPVVGHRFGEKVAVERSIFGSTIMSSCVNCGEVYIEKKPGIWPVIAGAALIIIAAVWAFMRRKKG